MSDKSKSYSDFAKLTVYENSEKYVITNNLVTNENCLRNPNEGQQKRMFLVFSKIKGTGEIIMIKDEYGNSCDEEVSNVYDDSYLDHFFKSNIFHKTFQIYAIYGMITLESNTYLILITGVQPISQIDNQIIYKVTQVEVKELLITQPNNSYLLKRAKDFFKHDGIYYSTYDLYSNIAYEHSNVADYEFMFNYNLIKSFLQLFERGPISNSSFSQEDDMGIKGLSELSHISYPQPEDLLQKYAFLSHFIAKSIFGSYESFTLCEHSQCSEQKDCLLHCVPYMGSSIEERDKFINRRSKNNFGVCKSLKQHVKSNFRFSKHNRHNTLKDSNQSCFEKGNITSMSPSFTVHLLSRRSHNNMGARFLRRGIRDGFPANSVETEQLIQVNHIVNSENDNKQEKKESSDETRLEIGQNLDYKNIHRSRKSEEPNVHVVEENKKIGHINHDHIAKNNDRNDNIVGDSVVNGNITSITQNSTDSTVINEADRLFNTINTRSHILSSFLQLRGSIPLCWRQDLSFKYTPNIKIIRSYEPLITYNSRVSRLYKSVFYLNLIKSSGYESALNLFYCKSLQDNNLKYLHYDFNKEGLHLSKKKKRELLSLLRPLLRRNKYKMMIWNKDFQNCGKSKYAMTPSPRQRNKSVQCPLSTQAAALTSQQGIIRTNCIDSLDRTNIVQYFIAEEVIQDQISAMVSIQSKSRKESISQNCYDNIHFTHKNNLNDVDNRSRLLLTQCLTNAGFHQKHKSLWIRNGHRLSRQYSGTNSLHSGAVGQLTRGIRTASSSYSSSSLTHNNLIDNSKYILARSLANDNFIERCSISFLRSKLNDLIYSIVRYFKNRFMHGDLQTTYDIITGSNVQMYKRKTRSFSFFHSFVCCTSVLFYMYYFLFYYGQDYTNTGSIKTIDSNIPNNINNFIKSRNSLNEDASINIEGPSLTVIDNTTSWISSDETRRNMLAIKDKIEPFLNDKIKSIITGIINKWEYYQMSPRLWKAFLLIQSLIPITCYDAILISVLSIIITLIVYFFVLGNCFNLPFYE